MSNGLIIGLLVLVAGLLLYPRIFSPKGETDAESADPDTTQIEERSIAVLPFEPLSSGEESKTFAQGVHDDLLTRLANISDLEVISRTAVQQYRDTDLTTGEIADSLGVRWVLEGGVQVLQDQIQVNAQLIDPRSETHAWAEDYRRDLTAADLFAVQGEITRKIAEALQAKLTAGEQKRLARRPTEDLQAYRLYARGRSHLDTRTAEGINKAVDYFRQALQEDSTYALAWAGLADAQGLRELYGPDSLGPSVPSLYEAARRALTLNPDLAEARASMGYLYLKRQNGPGALRELNRAIRLKPSYAQAHHWMGSLQLALGRPEPALRHLDLAADLSPHQPGILGMLAYAYLANGDPDAALTVARQIPEGVRGGRATEAEVLFHLERWTEVRGMVDRARPKSEGANANLLRIFPVMVDVATGDTARARRRFSKMDVKRLSPFYRGLLHGALGNRTEAFAAFRSINTWEPTWMLSELRYFYPDLLGPIREDPRYGKLIREINREWGLNPDGSIPAKAGPSVTEGAEADA